MPRYVWINKLHSKLIKKKNKIFFQSLTWIYYTSDQNVVINAYRNSTEIIHYIELDNWQSKVYLCLIFYLKIAKLCLRRQWIYTLSKYITFVFLHFIKCLPKTLRISASPAINIWLKDSQEKSSRLSISYFFFNALKVQSKVVFNTMVSIKLTDYGAYAPTITIQKI